MIKEINLTGHKIKVVNELKEIGISLSYEEMMFLKECLGRNPTIVEGYIFNVLWSEHCSYKSSKEILKKYLPTEEEWVIMGPGADAGVVDFGEVDGKKIWIVIGHESHNHPSQVLPFEGSATGIGGIVRDVYCMGAKVIGVLDCLRFGEPVGERSYLHKEITKGVVDGIWAYSNALGIPNLGGDIIFDSEYNNNCLVNVIAVGILEEGRVIPSKVPEEARNKPYALLLIGKPTDDSGLGGAAFASDALGHKPEKGAVQVPDPFLKRILAIAQEEILEYVFEKGIKIGYKDLGAGGIAVATAEMVAGSNMGAKLNLDLVPLSIKGLNPEVIAIAETQERYVMAVPADLIDKVKELYNKKYELPFIFPDAGANPVGVILPNSDFYTLTFQKEEVAKIPLKVLKTVPPVKRVEKRKNIFIYESPHRIEFVDIMREFPEFMKYYNISNKEFLWRHYDTEVQGRAVIRRGEADASVTAIGQAGLVISVAGDGIKCKIEPYRGAWYNTAEAISKVLAVGGVPISLTDCLNYGSPENPETYSDFVEGVKGIADCSRFAGQVIYRKNSIPVVSGNVSFYNLTVEGKSIPPTPIIACYGRINNFLNARPFTFINEDSFILWVGSYTNEIGGSMWARYKDKDRYNKNLPPIDLSKWKSYWLFILKINNLKLGACRFIGSGGFLFSLAEMFLKSPEPMGVLVDLRNNPNFKNFPASLVAEQGGFIIEIPFNLRQEVEGLLRITNAQHFWIGKTNLENSFSVLSQDETYKWERTELNKMWNSLKF